MIDREILENWKEEEKENLKNFERIDRFIFFLNTHSEFTLNLMEYLNKHKKVVEKLFK